MAADDRTVSHAAHPMTTLAAWRVAMRPRSLPVAVSPVIVGAAIGWLRGGTLNLKVVLAVLAASLLMQVITNMQNDVGYTVRGGERSGTRTGLPRATANGWLSVGHVRRAIVIASLVATAIGLVLVHERGWPVLAIGAASLAAALAYMGGPRPIAYTPFGEATVFAFFGLVAVIGTDWVLTGGFDAITVVAAIGVGAIASAALAVNNHRDIAHDRLVGRRTYAVVFGAAASHALFSALLWLPFALTPLMAWMAHAPTLLLPCVLLAQVTQLRRDFIACPPGLAYNGVLFHTFKMGLAFASLLALGAVLGRLLA